MSDGPLPDEEIVELLGCFSLVVIFSLVTAGVWTWMANR